MRDYVAESLERFKNFWNLAEEDNRRTTKLIKDYENGDYNEHDLLKDAMERLKTKERIINGFKYIDNDVAHMSAEQAQKYYKTKYNIREPEGSNFPMEWHLSRFLEELIKLRHFKDTVYTCMDTIRKSNK